MRHFLSIHVAQRVLLQITKSYNTILLFCFLSNSVLPVIVWFTSLPYWYLFLTIHDSWIMSFLSYIWLYPQSYVLMQNELFYYMVLSTNSWMVLKHSAQGRQLNIAINQCYPTSSRQSFLPPIYLSLEIYQSHFINEFGMTSSPFSNLDLHSLC